MRVDACAVQVGKLPCGVIHPPALLSPLTPHRRSVQYDHFASHSAASLTHTTPRLPACLLTQNVVLDVRGYPKLIDFSFAKKTVDRTFTQCGTPDYVSPEMLTGQGVRQECDLWGLGVVAYEMLTSCFPFSDPEGDEMRTFSNILDGAWRWPPTPHLSKEVKAFVEGLLKISVSERLGNGRFGYQRIMKHAWYTGFPWEDLANKLLTPPWIPIINGMQDIQGSAAEAHHQTAGAPPPHDLSQIQKFEEVWAAFR